MTSRGPPSGPFRQARRAVLSGEYAVVTLDEANVATHFGLLAVEDLLELVDGKPPEMEIVITGRWADPRVVERADLVTEMRELKHYYSRGVRARPGIERWSARGLGPQRVRVRWAAQVRGQTEIGRRGPAPHLKP